MLRKRITEQVDFFCGNDPKALVRAYGSPLYVYSEAILRKNCRALKQMASYSDFHVNFSAKANSNLALLQIVREEGLDVDAVSNGEIVIELKAGFTPEQIFYVTNNASAEEMRFAIDKGILMSVDSVSQLAQFGRLNPGGAVAVRFNPGIGAGHHAKVVTGGDKTKFGVNIEHTYEVKKILAEYDLKLVGINQHIGSLFMDSKPFMDSVQVIKNIAKEFPELAFIDFGGGFGTPYKKQKGEPPLDLRLLGQNLDAFMAAFSAEYGRPLAYKIEPGRYVVAETCVLLGTVYSTKNNGKDKYIGTDIGFNVLVRPVMYDAYHEIEVYNDAREEELVNVVGNICESGDFLAKDIVLPSITEGDVIGVLDAGAYGYAMSSTYNVRMRPAEVLIRENGETVLIRERDRIEDMMSQMIPLY